MTHRLRRMPVAPEVDTLQCEIGSDEEFLAGRGPNYRTIIANPGNNLGRKRLRTRGMSRQLSNLVD